MSRLKQVGWGAGVAGLVLAATGVAIATGTNTSTGSADGARTHTEVRAVAVISAEDRNKAAEAFSACMRENGVANFPGVTISENGQVHLNLSDADLNPISAQYRKAAAACGHLLPEGSTLPEAPQEPTVAVPSLGFTCSGDFCPKAPEAPAPPN